MTKIHQVHSKSAGHFAKEFPCLSPYKIEGSFALKFIHLFEISDIVIGIIKLYLHSAPINFLLSMISLFDTGFLT